MDYFSQLACTLKMLYLKTIRQHLFAHLSDGPRPSCEEVMEIRKQMLHYVKALILKGQGIHEDELQSILNYLTTVHEVRGGRAGAAGVGTGRAQGSRGHEKRQRQA